VPTSQTYAQVDLADADEVVALLCGSEWPFHGTGRLTAEEAADVEFDGPATVSFWILDDGRRIGLIRVFDLDDLVNGSPLFDIRIATQHRGAGVGGQAVRWLTGHLFSTYPELHRIEATTRADNAAMQRALERAGWHREGQLREAWRSADGTRHDTLVYGTLRSDR
jgi:RimJ/RimL family protein N-acetyltransferase